MRLALGFVAFGLVVAFGFVAWWQLWGGATPPSWVPIVMVAATLWGMWNWLGARYRTSCERTMPDHAEDGADGRVEADVGHELARYKSQMLAMLAIDLGYDGEPPVTAPARHRVAWNFATADWDAIMPHCRPLDMEIGWLIESRKDNMKHGIGLPAENARLRAELARLTGAAGGD